MSLKKKSKSLGHLTALGSHPCSPDVEPKVCNRKRRELFDKEKQTSRKKGLSGEAGVYMQNVLQIGGCNWSTYSGEDWLRLVVFTNESFLLQLKKNASQTKFTGVPSPDGPQGQVRTLRFG